VDHVVDAGDKSFLVVGHVSIVGSLLDLGECREASDATADFERPREPDRVRRVDPHDIRPPTPADLDPVDGLGPVRLLTGGGGDERLAATVEASSQSVDVASGTTRMQLALDNAMGELLPGGYANVKLSLTRDAAPLHIPASALIFNQNGLRVATVGPDDKVLFKTVTIARDLGRDIELGSGVAADDRIIIAPPDGLADGDQARVVGGGRSKADKPTAVSEKQKSRT
jgi:multidrug efflux pump subunit AcrA (membrane-fusion protein)